MDDFEGFMTSVGGVIAYVVEITREIEVKSEDLTKLLQSHDESFIDEKLFLMAEQRK